MDNHQIDSPIGTTSASDFDTPSTGSRSSVRDKASELGDQAKEKARHAAEQQKGRAAGELNALASALHRAGDHLESEGHMSARLIYGAADRLDGLTQTLDDQDVAGLVRSVRSFARRNPAAFIGGATALGFLAARFFKAADDQQEETSFDHDYESAYSGGRDSQFGGRDEL
jgi:hypothetical protein